MLAFAPPEAGAYATGCDWYVSSTNSELANAGCSDTTDVTLADVVDGTTVKILAVGGDSWPSIAQFSTIAELKALVDNHASTKNGIARLTQVGQTTKLIINSPTSGDGEFSFEVHESTGIISGYVMNMADPNAYAAEHLIIFIESQP